MIFYLPFQIHSNVYNWDFAIFKEVPILETV